MTEAETKKPGYKNCTICDGRGTSIIDKNKPCLVCDGTGEAKALSRSGIEVFGAENLAAAMLKCGIAPQGELLETLCNRYPDIAGNLRQLANVRFWNPSAYTISFKPTTITQTEGIKND